MFQINILEIGRGWMEAALDTQEEYNFLRLGQRSFSNGDSYWISGSTNSLVGSTFEFSAYFANVSGKLSLKLSSIIYYYQAVGYKLYVIKHRLHL